MRLWLGVLLGVAGAARAVSPRAVGPIHLWTCHDSRTIADAGYYAGIHWTTKGLTADFGRQSILGPRKLGGYAVVEMTPPHLGETTSLLYVDRQAAGQQFTLVIREDGTSNLRAKDDTGRWHSVRFRCQRTRNAAP